MFEEIYRRLNALESAQNQLVRVGKVTSVDPSRGLVRVQVPDADGLVTKQIQTLHGKTKSDKHFTCPDVGEQMLCLFLGNGLSTGFALGAVYSKPDTTPEGMTADKEHILFSDGTWIEYDRATHKLTANVQGEADIITTGDIKVKAGENHTVDVAGRCVVVTQEDADIDCKKVLNLRGQDGIVFWGSTTTVGYEPASFPE